MRVLAIACLLAVGLVACGDDDSGTAASTAAPSATGAVPKPEPTEAAESPGTASGNTGGTEAAAECPNRPSGSSPAQFDAASGTYAVSIIQFSADAPSVSFDVVQWLVGQDAADAYHEEYPEDPEGPPNDYWIRNQNPQLREAPVAADADVRLVRLAADRNADVSPGTIAEIPDYLARGFPSPVWWLTFEGGTVTAVCEQYVP